MIGGGSWAGGGLWVVARGCWREITGGSFAKTSLKTERKSFRLDLSQKSTQPAKYG